MLSWSPFRCFLGPFRAFFFEFSHLLGLFHNFFGLAFRELLIFSPKILSMVTTAVTLPVLEFSIAISLALIVSRSTLVDLIGRVSVDIKRMPMGCSNLRHLSAGSRFPVLLYTLSLSVSISPSDESRVRFLLLFGFIKLLFELSQFLS